ncbi:MAG: hypothetical protein J7519_11780 [Roseofilum sp. SID1]|uniref:hypothetical protein n=1 Tax=Roseofilum sp. SID1 TaxID=2821497 RepID=UPI001B0F783C|nr:hypothetical protein [Roseofilum sp. SID1]MBP0038369.1 hypothetical protein [Roseofilum sp. SID1]
MEIGVNKDTAPTDWDTLKATVRDRSGCCRKLTGRGAAVATSIGESWKSFGAIAAFTALAQSVLTVSIRGCELS